MLDLYRTCGKATAVITRFATAVGVDVQEKTTAGSPAVSRDIMCLSCSAPIVMGFGAMVGLAEQLDEDRLNSFRAKSTDTTLTST